MANAMAAFGPTLIVSLIPWATWLQLRSPIRSQEYFLKLATFLVVVLFLCGKLVGRLHRPKIDIPFIAAALAAFAMLMSCLLAPEPLYSFNAALPWFSGIALFFLWRSAAARHDLFRLASWFLTIASGPIALYGIFQNFGYEFLPYSDFYPKNETIATFGHPNYYSSFMGPMFYICLARALMPGFVPGRIYAGLTAGVIAVGLYFAKSQSVIMGVMLGAATVVALGLPWPRRVVALVRDRRFWISVGAVLLLAAMLVGQMIGTPAYDRFSRRFHQKTASSDMETRTLFWQVAADMHAPWAPFGIGKAMYELKFWDGVEKLLDSPRGPYFHRNLTALTAGPKPLDPGNVHNDYLEIYAEAGTLGLFAHLLLVLWLLVFSIRALTAHRSRLIFPGAVFLGRAFLLAAFIVMVFDSLLGFPLMLPCSLTLFWFLCAALWQQARDPELQTGAPAHESPATAIIPQAWELPARIAIVAGICICAVMGAKTYQYLRGDLIIFTTPVADNNTNELKAEVLSERIQKGMRLSPLTWQAYLQNANYLIILGENAKALDQINRALRYHTRIGALVLEANALNNVGQTEEALQKFERLHRLSFFDRAVIQNLMRIYSRTENYANLMPLALETDMRWPNMFDPMVAMGNTVLQDEDLTLFMKYYLVAAHAPMSGVMRPDPPVYSRPDIIERLHQASVLVRHKTYWSQSPPEYKGPK